MSCHASCSSRPSSIWFSNGTKDWVVFRGAGTAVPVASPAHLVGSRLGSFRLGFASVYMLLSLWRGFARVDAASGFRRRGVVEEFSASLALPIEGGNRQRVGRTFQRETETARTSALQ